MTEPTPRGRPAGPEGPLTVQAKIRFDPAGYRLVCARARAEGSSVSGWIRAKALEAARGNAPEKRPAPPEPR